MPIGFIASLKPRNINTNTENINTLFATATSDSIISDINTSDTEITDNSITSSVNANSNVSDDSDSNIGDSISTSNIDMTTNSNSNQNEIDTNGNNVSINEIDELIKIESVTTDNVELSELDSLRLNIDSDIKSLINNRVVIDDFDV